MSYTFQRPRKRKVPRGDTAVEHYTSTATIDPSSSGGNRFDYEKWSFYIFLFMFAYMILGSIYIFMKGMPVRIKV